MNIDELLKDYRVIRTKKTERGELLKEFMNCVNMERTEKFPQIHFSRIAFLLQHLSTSDLYAFLSMCKDRQKVNGSFSKFFWWALKTDAKI